MNLGMKLSGFSLALASLLSSPIAQANKYETVLIGGGLEICNSLEPRNCKTKLRTTESTHTENQFVISKSRLQTLKKRYADNDVLHSKEMTQIVAKLSVLDVNKKTLNERELKAFFREQQIDLRRNASAKQQQFIWDVLQQPIVLKRFLQKDGVKKVKVNISDSRKEFVGRSMREFLSQVNGDEIVFVTAANSDAFADVYLLKQAFEQMDVEATWLPIDVAVAEIWRKTNVRDKESLEKACTTTEQVRRDIAARFNRGDIYPKLNEQLTKICQDPSQLAELIDDANAVYFHTGNPKHLIDSMMVDAKTPFPFFKQIVRRHNESKLVLGFNGGAINAIAGNGRNNAVIVEGDSHEALQSTSTSNPGRALRQGLGLFDHVVFDHAVGEFSRQMRMMTTMLEFNIPIGIGIDERTVALVDTTKNGMNLVAKGEAGVTLLSSMDAELIRKQPVLLRDMKMAYMTQEDQVEINNNKLVFDFANWKYSSNSSRQPVVNSGDALRANNFQKTMYMLCSTAANKATMKHVELGKGHQIEVTKLSNSVSVAGSRNVSGSSFGYCSFRDYGVTAIPLKTR